jgi:hypothetical protein
LFWWCLFNSMIIVYVGFWKKESCTTTHLTGKGLVKAHTAHTHTATATENTRTGTSHNPHSHTHTKTRTHCTADTPTTTSQQLVRNTTCVHVPTRFFFWFSASVPYR